MPLDSDIVNADAHLRVEFFTYDKPGSFKGVPHVRISTPGDKTNIPELVATDYHKQRFQREWLHYQMANSEELIIGTPLIDWHKERPEELTEGQMQELFILKFQSVEQIANASDMQVQRIGMGAAGIRQRARTYLSSKNAQQSGAELQQAKDELLMLKASMQRMEAAMAEMAKAPPKEEVYRAGAAKRAPSAKQIAWRNRKKKVLENVQHDDGATGSAGL